MYPVSLFSDKRTCCICCDTFESKDGIACGNGHFACLDCQGGWLEVRLAEYNVSLQCCALATCPSSFHPTTFFGFLKNPALKQKWHQTTLELWRKKEAQKQKERRESVGSSARVGVVLSGGGGDGEDDEELWIDCVNCTYYEIGIRKDLKEVGGVWQCRGCGVVSCHLCVPVSKLANNMEAYARLAESSPHSHVQDLRYLFFFSFHFLFISFLFPFIVFVPVFLSFPLPSLYHFPPPISYFFAFLLFSSFSSLSFFYFSLFPFLIPVGFVPVFPLPFSYGGCRRYIWRARIEGIITNASLPSCPGCGFLASKEVGCNAMQCPSCKTRFCFVCSQGLPTEGNKAHDAFNPDAHHNRSLMCQLFEEDDDATKKKAGHNIREAFMGDPNISQSELIELCGDMLRAIEFSFYAPETNWECCCM